MGKYNWKDNYESPFDETVYKVLWASVLGNKGVSLANSTRENPTYSLGNNWMNNPNGNDPVRIVISSGIHTGQYSSSNGTSYVCGQGMDNTIWKKTLYVVYPNSIRFYNMTLNYTGTTTLGCEAHWCDVKSVANTTNAFYNCKLRMESLGSITNTSIIGLTLAVSRYSANTILYDNCNISILSQSDVNLSTTRYAAFNNCKFKIGASETEYTALSGTTPEELRASFVQRCTDAAYTLLTPVEEYGESLQAGRWIFSNNSCMDGLVITGSEIHEYEKIRLVAFGYKTDRNEILPITTDKTRAGSFSSAYADSTLNVTEGAIGVKATTDISQKLSMPIRSNIIWLGGKYQVNLIDIIHNLPKEYGVWLDNTLTLADTSTTVIESGKTYYVRSSDSNKASIVYNSGTYTSALVNNNNVFIGVSTATTFTDTNGNAQVFEVIDNKAVHQTIQMRIVDTIPSAKIISGVLTVGTWYLVEHANDQTNTTEYVTYNGSKYYVGSSFLVVSGATSFTPSSANVHLRECWSDNYTYGSNSFYTGKQQPVWFDILPNDPRCLMRNNNNLEAEMQTDANNNYITSGHPDFYDLILGSSGSKLPAYQIKGTYMQLRLVITTQNPM
jgi:hypothetical protein